jgi:hypothetical protein
MSNRWNGESENHAAGLIAILENQSPHENPPLNGRESHLIASLDYHVRARCHALIFAAIPLLSGATRRDVRCTVALSASKTNGFRLAVEMTLSGSVRLQFSRVENFSVGGSVKKAGFTGESATRRSRSNRGRATPR